MAEIQENTRTTVILCLLALGGAIASGTLLSNGLKGLAQAVPEYNTAGEVVGFVGSIADITDLKRAEETLKAKTAELDRFFSVALDLLCIATTDGLLLRVNPQWEKVLGHAIAELEGSRFLD